MTDAASPIHPAPECLVPRAGFEPLHARLPAHACDSHAHVFGPYAQYPLADDRSYTPIEFPVGSFLAHLDRFGIERGVLVTGSASGTDNGSVLAALRSAPARLRGVVVPSVDATDRQLDDWHADGVRGVRINLFRRGGHAVYRNGVGFDVIESLAPRLAERGWHVQVWIHAPDLPELMPRLEQLGVPLVVDHMGRMSTDRGVNDPGFQHLVRAVGEGRAWTKISGADRNTVDGPPYDDITPYATALLAANPERIVWGSDWPHINYYEPTKMPDDGALVNRLLDWLPNVALRQRVLVDNPAALYGFPSG